MKSKKLILLFVSVFLISILMSSCKHATKAVEILSKTGKLCNKVVTSYNEINDFANLAKDVIEGINQDKMEEDEDRITAAQAFQLYTYDIYYGNSGDFVSTLKFANNVPPQMQQQFIEATNALQQYIQSMIQQGHQFSCQVTNVVENEDGSVFIYSNSYLNGQLLDNNNNTPDIMVIGNDGCWYQLITYELAAECIQSYIEMQQQMSYQ